MVDFSKEFITQQSIDYGGHIWNASHPDFATGAKMDGVTNDLDAWNAAILKAYESGGGIVTAGMLGRNSDGLGVSKISGTLLMRSNVILDLTSIALIRGAVAGEGLITNVPGATKFEIWGGVIECLKGTFGAVQNRGIFLQYASDFKVRGTHVKNSYGDSIRFDHETTDWELESPLIEDSGENGLMLRSLTSGVSAPVRTGTGNGSLRNLKPAWTGTYTLPSAQYESWTLTRLSSGEWSVVGSVTGAYANAIVGMLYTNSKISFRIVQGSTAFVTGDTFTFEVGPDGQGNNLGKSPNTCARGKVIKPRILRSAISNILQFNAGGITYDSPYTDESFGGRGMNIGAYSIGAEINNPQINRSHSTGIHMNRCSAVHTRGGRVLYVTEDASGIGQEGQCVKSYLDVVNCSLEGTELAYAATDGWAAMAGTTGFKVVNVHSHDNGKNIPAARTGNAAGADGFRLQAGVIGAPSSEYSYEGDVRNIELVGITGDFNASGSGVKSLSTDGGYSVVEEVNIPSAHLHDNARYGFDPDEHTTEVQLGNIEPKRNVLGAFGADIDPSVTRSALRRWDSVTEAWVADDAGITTPITELIPYYADPAARDAALPAPALNQRAHVRTLGHIQRYNGTTWENALTSSLLRKRVWWIDEEGGADGSGMGNQVAAINATVAAIPDQGTMGIPNGRFRLPDQLIIDRPINVEGHGSGSCLWVEQDVYPLPAWANSYGGVQFGQPHEGYPGEPPRSVQHIRLSNFSVQGASDVNPKYGLAMFSVMHSRIEGLHSMARAGRAATFCAAWNGTRAEILCDANSGAGSIPETIYFSGNPSAVTATTATVTPPTTWSTNGLRRKTLRVVSGPGAGTDYRIISHTAAGEITVASWYGGTPTTSSVLQVLDTLTYPTGEAHLIIGTLDGATAPFPGRPAGWVSGQDPMNANKFRLVLRGNNGASGSGILCEPQIAGGNNYYEGLVEGFPDNGSYNTTYGLPKYCMKILTSSGFALALHTESAGLSTADPNVIIDGSCGSFELGPTMYVDQELKIIDSTGYEINGGIYTQVRRVWSGGGAPNPTDPTKYRISPAAYIGTLI